MKYLDRSAEALERGLAAVTRAARWHAGRASSAWLVALIALPGLATLAGSGALALGRGSGLAAQGPLASFALRALAACARVLPVIACVVWLKVWGSLVYGVLAQNTPQAARLVPGHAAALRRLLLAATGLLALAGGWPLSQAGGVPFAQGAGQALLLMGASLVAARWVVLWLFALAGGVLALVLPLAAPAAMAQGVAFVAALWRQPPGLGHTAGVLAWSLGAAALALAAVRAVVQGGDAEHRARQAGRERVRRLRAGPGRSNAEGITLSGLGDARRWMQGLPPGLHPRAAWRTVFVTQCLFLSLLALLWFRHGNAGMHGVWLATVVNVLVMSFAADMGSVAVRWRHMLHDASAELRLLRLLPGTPTGRAAFARALRARQQLQAAAMGLVLVAGWTLTYLTDARNGDSCAVLWVAWGHACVLPWVLALPLPASTSAIARVLPGVTRQRSGSRRTASGFLAGLGRRVGRRVDHGGYVIGLTVGACLMWFNWAAPHWMFDTATFAASALLAAAWGRAQELATRR